VDSSAAKVTVTHLDETAIFTRDRPGGARLGDGRAGETFEATLDLTRRAEQEVRCPACGRAIAIDVFPGLPWGKAVRAAVRERGRASTLVHVVPFAASLCVLVAVAALGLGRQLSPDSASSLGTVFFVIWIGSAIMLFVGLGSTVAEHMGPRCVAPEGHEVRHGGEEISRFARLDLREPFYDAR
jgi:hypothetical protein